MISCRKPGTTDVDAFEAWRKESSNCLLSGFLWDSKNSCDSVVKSHCFSRVLIKDDLPLGVLSVDSFGVLGLALGKSITDNLIIELIKNSIKEYQEHEERKASFVKAVVPSTFSKSGIEVFEQAGFIQVSSTDDSTELWHWMSVIPYGRQTIEAEDVNAAAKALTSSFLTTGPEVGSFERDIAAAFGSKYAIACNSGTAALHLACMVLGITEGDEVITSPLTFAASANCARYCGASVEFCDVNDMGLLDVALLEKKITPRTKAIIPVHYAGQACDMEALHEIAKKYKLHIIEDGCHSPKARYSDSSIGDCKFSDMCSFSLHPVKHFTTAEGGIITTNNEAMYEKLKRLRSHGITKDQSLLAEKDQGGWYYEIPELGYNYRIPDVLCALGKSQLSRLDGFIERRQAIAEKYRELLKGLPVTLPKVGNNRSHVYHLFVILLKDGAERRELYDYLFGLKIYVQVHYVPVYWHPAYGAQKNVCPKADDFYQRCLSLPIFPTLKVEEQYFVAASIRSFFRAKK